MQWYDLLDRFINNRGPPSTPQSNNQRESDTVPMQSLNQNETQDIYRKNLTFLFCYQILKYKIIPL
jgi:hypothetical protein